MIVARRWSNSNDATETPQTERPYPCGAPLVGGGRRALVYHWSEVAFNKRNNDGVRRCGGKRCEVENLVEFTDFAGKLIESMGPSPLDAGVIDQQATQSLASIRDEELFGAAVVNADAASCCRAALWLRANDLDGSHRISQGIASAEGSYWHAIMHRREPDYSNSLYWFRRVGRHPVLEGLAGDAAKRATAMGDESLAAPLAPGGDWSPKAFGEMCRKSLGRGDRTEEFAVAVQDDEWRRLFEYCYRMAIGE